MRPILLSVKHNFNQDMVTESFRVHIVLSADRLNIYVAPNRDEIIGRHLIYKLYRYFKLDL